VGDQIGYRYLVAEIVDKGALGQVVRAFDIKEQGKEVAVKISRNKKFDFYNGQVEYKILTPKRTGGGDRQYSNFASMR
jgi:hypothetical protein